VTQEFGHPPPEYVRRGVTPGSERDTGYNTCSGPKSVSRVSRVHSAVSGTSLLARNPWPGERFRLEKRVEAFDGRFLALARSRARRVRARVSEGRVRSRG
jgi:hypothetical protein